MKGLFSHLINMGDSGDFQLDEVTHARINSGLVKYGSFFTVLGVFEDGKFNCVIRFA